MRVFVVGSTGAVGKFLVPHLVENGHDVVALVRTAQKAKALVALGAKVALADALNKRGVDSSHQEGGARSDHPSAHSPASATSRNSTKSSR
jgi:nucleoside-diphosphate-sugar epimerase